jgi:hypothetical protein
VAAVRACTYNGIADDDQFGIVRRHGGHEFCIDVVEWLGFCSRAIQKSESHVHGTILLKTSETRPSQRRVHVEQSTASCVRTNLRHALHNTNKATANDKTEASAK